MTEKFRSPLQALVGLGQIEHHRADMTATFSFDVTLDEAQEKLAEADQWLAIDGDPSHQLGELLQSNSTGPLRLGYGAWRDVLLGCQFTNGQGELITAGGRTMKNVAGYDLTKFMIGQHGIFGAIVSLTMRTYKRPGAALLASFTPDVSLLSNLLITPAKPQWSLLHSGELLCGYLGDEPTISFLQSEVASHRPTSLHRQSLQEDSELRARRWRNGDFRAAVAPSRIHQLISEAQLTNWIADPAFGVVLGSCDPARRAALLTAIDQMNGSIVFLSPSGRALSVGDDPAILALLARLKVAFDPYDRLHPLPSGQI